MDVMSCHACMHARYCVSELRQSAEDEKPRGHAFKAVVLMSALQQDQQS